MKVKEVQRGVVSSKAEAFTEWLGKKTRGPALAADVATARLLLSRCH